VVKAALGRVREGAAARARELGDEALALQERLDAGRHTAAERAEDAGALGEQARTAPGAPGSGCGMVGLGSRRALRCAARGRPLRWRPAQRSAQTRQPAGRLLQSTRWCACVGGSSATKSCCRSWHACSLP